MLPHLVNAISPPSVPRAPSALLAVGNFQTMINVLHLLPEDGTTERFGHTTPPATTTFRHRGATEQAREEIGEVTLYVGDGESVAGFLDDVEIRARKLWNECLGSMESVESTQLVRHVLKPAAVDAILSREGRDRSMNATQAYPVFIIRILRSKPGKILTDEPTSFPQ